MRVFIHTQIPIHRKEIKETNNESVNHPAMQIAEVVYVCVVVCVCVCARACAFVCVCTKNQRERERERLKPQEALLPPCLKQVHLQSKDRPKLGTDK